MIEPLDTTSVISNAETIAIECFGVTTRLPLLAVFEEDDDQEEPYDPDDGPDADDELDEDEFEDDDLDEDDDDDDDDADV